VKDQAGLRMGNKKAPMKGLSFDAIAIGRLNYKDLDGKVVLKKRQRELSQQEQKLQEEKLNPQ
jgi:hypothetical protein